jgi:hypothetical protein
MGLELFFVIFGLIAGIIAIITSRFFGNLTISVWTDMRNSATHTFGNKLWIRIWFWWTTKSLHPKVVIWFIRICGVLVVGSSLFILIWVFGN